jgi:hypothetical protein
MFHWFKTILAMTALILAVVLGWPFLLAVALIALGAYTRRKWQQWSASTRFRATWLPQGKDLLLVYSNSPHWQRYIEDNWLPQWGERAVVLNWSERQTWRHSRTPEAALFLAFAGDREFNPLAIFVSDSGEVRVVRFWRAFRDFKHGKDRSLRLAEAELESALASAGRGA